SLSPDGRVRASREYGEQALAYLRTLERRPPAGLAGRLRAAGVRPLAALPGLKAGGQGTPGGPPPRGALGRRGRGPAPARGARPRDSSLAGDQRLERLAQRRPLALAEQRLGSVSLVAVEQAVGALGVPAVQVVADGDGRQAEDAGDLGRGARLVPSQQPDGVPAHLLDGVPVGQVALPGLPGGQVV